MQSRGTARIPPRPGAAATPKRLLKFVFATQPVWAQTANQAKFIPLQN
jgi:hypothetical protein